MDQNAIALALKTLTDTNEKLKDMNSGLHARVLEVEQKLTVRGERTGGGDDMQLSRLLIDSDGLKSFLA